jgi:mRNA-degrading endonuclease toxin of MazEF toxin-antitoxin module
VIARGDIRWFRFNAPDKRRPVLVLGRPDILPSLSQVPVLPISTSARGLSWEVALTEADGVLSAAQQATVTANSNFLLGQVEAAFTATTGWFGTDTTRFGTSSRQQVLFDQADSGGASNGGYGSSINLDVQSNNNANTAGPIVSMWMTEWSEILMSLTSTWHSGDSSGEGLSQYSAGTLFHAGHNDYYGGGSSRTGSTAARLGQRTTRPLLRPPTQRAPIGSIRRRARAIRSAAMAIW